jgi:hypothetical protein
LDNPALSLRGAVFALVAALLLISIPSVLSSEEIVLHRFSSAQPDQQLEEVLYLAAGVALMQAGLTSIREGGEANYILEVQYTSKKAETALRYTLYRPQSPKDILADMTVDVLVDDTLDARVATGVRQLLQTAGIEAVPSPLAHIEGLLPASPPLVIGGEKTKSDAIVVKTPTDTPAGEATPMRFVSSISAAGVVLFGAITEFLHYGVGGLLRAGVTWPHKSWSPTLGVEVSFTRAFNDDGVIGGPLYLATAGPMVQLGTGTSTPYSAAVAVSGGAALITVETIAKTKTAPYADAVVQAAFPVGGKILLGADARFLAVFADDMLIIAVAPALVVRVEL